MNRVVQKQIVKTLCGEYVDADKLQEVLTEVAGKGEITYDMTIAAALILSGKFPDIPLNKFHITGNNELLHASEYNRIKDIVYYDVLKVEKDGKGNRTFLWKEQHGVMSYAKWQDDWNHPAKHKLLNINDKDSAIDIWLQTSTMYQQKSIVDQPVIR